MKATKNIILLFHLGLRKTATTFMQEKIFPNIDTSIFFGKQKSHSQMMYDQHFTETHSLLFNRLYTTQRYRSRNSANLINLYANHISNEIAKNCSEDSKYTSAVISDENLLGYGEYNAELNILLIKRIISKIKASLKTHNINIQPKFLVTFREQASYLQSFYAYCYPFIPKQLSNIDNYIEFATMNSKDEVFGGLFFDEVLEFLEEIFPEDVILFAPYEWIAKDPTFFLEQTIVKLGLLPKKELNSFNLTKQVNSNRLANNENRIIEVTNTSKIIQHAHKFKKLIPVFLHESAKKKIAKIQQKQIGYSKKSLKLNSDQQNTIRRIYSSSNSNLEKRLNISLKSLGYICEE